ncbi:MAG: helix-turn-helix transcriptional regulator [Gammaproteobacteria bacterium]|nr:helix-turn-helix transcriptional regulator [Gammaproteobacteria bacterium]
MTSHRVAELIALERLRLGLSQAELALRAGLTQPDLSKVERGDRKLSAEEFLALLRALRFTDNPTLQRRIYALLEVGVVDGSSGEE